MQSLSQLNGRSTTDLEVADTRLATVNFDRLEPTNQPITITGLVYPAIPVGIEIAEIVNYDIADCTVKFTIVSKDDNVLTGSTLEWNAIPEGITLTTSGQEYTLTGFSKVAQWNQIKNPIWNIPSTYTTKRPFYVQVDISYVDQEASVIRTKSYNVFDPLYYYEASLVGEFGFAFDITKLRRFSAAWTTAFILRAQRDVELSSRFVLTAAVQDVKFAAATLTTSSPTFVCSFDVLPALTNDKVIRTYVANKESQPFLTNTPQIIDPRNGTYTVVLTASNAQFSLNTTSSSASLTLTGTKATINSQIANIYFMPDWNVLSNLSITWTQKYNGTTYVTRSMAVNYSSNNNDYKYVTFTTVGTHTYTPTFLEKKYCQIIRGMIGGGGTAGQYSGGHAGQWKLNGDSQPLNSYSFTINGAGLSTVYNAGASSVIANAPSPAAETQNITQYYSGYYGAPLNPDYLLFIRGYGGKNGDGVYAGSNYYGRSENISSTYTTTTISNYRTEIGGSGGNPVINFGRQFGRGGNGRVYVPSYPVVVPEPSQSPYDRKTRYNYTTAYSGGTTSQYNWGNGGDAPGGAGQSGAVLITISRRLNSNGV